ncbi:MAG: serine hydrolase domain-containing protein, partial [Acidimicrobiia bacterium]
MNLESIEELIERELERWKVPALEVVAVKAGEVVLAKAYGKRNLERDLPATPKTLFHHGSTGKAFTAFLIGTLVDEGLIEWDRPVREYLPEFRLSDPTLSDRVTVKDLLSHRTGLPRHEWVWIPNPSWSREEIVKRLKHLELNRDLRQQWQYSNLAYITAGHLAGVVTGSTWEEQMRSRVFEPLGMNRTVTSIEAFKADEDHAWPYFERDDEVKETIFRNLDTAAPAGQILSCAEETARWLLCQTGGGEVDGKRIISEASFKETHTLQMSTGSMLDSPELPHIKFYGYCLGWVRGLYRGQEWLWHNGGIDG